MDLADIDEKGKGILFYGETIVEKCFAVKGQSNIYLLQTTIVQQHENQIGPKPGQFYLIKGQKSDVQYNRPISVYRCEEKFNRTTSRSEYTVQFMIMEKGRGTQELCHLTAGEKMKIIGPLGTPWPSPSETVDFSKNEICIVGGGIGVAPVANLASSLPDGSYDFYASFKSGSYGLEHIHPSNLVITTDDGSEGIKGMLPVAFTKDAVKKAGYKVIYACGPTPALAYVKSVAEELGIQCYVSMEHRMLCGLGACLGCTIDTSIGKKRVCKDGPVFDSKIITFPKPSSRRKPLEENEEPDLTVNLAGITLKNPVIATAGTFAYGQNYRGVSDVRWWGAITSKGITYEPRVGNGGERCLEVVGGNMNSIGLQNPGVPYFVDNLLSPMLELGPEVIVNLAGKDITEYINGARMLDKTDAKIIELNISCPNVSGTPFGMDPELAYWAVKLVKEEIHKPLFVKLSPNAPDICEVAEYCINAGADGLSLINMVHGVAINIEEGKPFFEKVHAGWSGPALKPLALRMVYDVIARINTLPPEKRVPVIGIGGISDWKDAVEFIMAGAAAVGVGAAKFTNPDVAKDITEGMKAFMKSHGYRNLAQMRGIAQVDKGVV
ncbi:MAG: dihydroorotate dehydrogenase [Treponema sp.]|nr:dihydroorotate dehydrogenase [Treponema sp.]